MFSVREDLARNNLKPEDAGQAFWDWIAIHEELSEDDMREFQDKFNWRKLSDHQKHLTESFIREFSDRVHWDRISQRIQMSETFIEEFHDKVTWDYIWSYQRKLSCDFIEKHLKNVNWGRVVVYQKLTDDFIKNHVSDMSIYDILHYQKPKKDLIEFLEEYAKQLPEGKRKHYEEKILEHKIYYTSDVTEKEILQFLSNRKKHNWGGTGWWDVLENQKLNEKFIEEHYEEIKNDSYAFVHIWRHQILSEEFLKKHEEDVNWSKVKQNRRIKKTKWIKEKIK